MAGGCGGFVDFTSPDRLDKGLIIILPGIEGESGLNHDIRNGLVAAGVDQALKIRPWGRLLPPPLNMLVTQMDIIGNRIAAAIIANEVVEYRKQYPGRPVYVVGHSGGGGIAVFVAEAMPKDHKIDGLILLSASVSSAYNVTKALSNCEQGIVNFYNRGDGLLLGVATTLFGNVDGIRGPSAGLLSFDEPRESAGKEEKAAYEHLFQVQLTDDMTLGYTTAHASTTEPGFVSIYVAPWLLSRQWPAMDSATEWTRQDGTAPNSTLARQP